MDAPRYRLRRLRRPAEPIAAEWTNHSRPADRYLRRGPAPTATPIGP